MHRPTITLAILAIAAGVLFDTQAEACGGSGYRVARSHQTAWRTARTVKSPTSETIRVAKSEAKEDEGPVKAASHNESSSIALAEKLMLIKTSSAEQSPAKIGCTRYFPAVSMTLPVSCE